MRAGCALCNLILLPTFPLPDTLAPPTTVHAPGESPRGAEVARTPRQLENLNTASAEGRRYFRCRPRLLACRACQGERGQSAQGWAGRTTKLAARSGWRWRAGLDDGRANESKGGGNAVERRRGVAITITNPSIVHLVPGSGPWCQSEGRYGSTGTG